MPLAYSDKIVAGRYMPSCPVRIVGDAPNVHGSAVEDRQLASRQRPMAPKVNIRRHYVTSPCDLKRAAFSDGSKGVAFFCAESVSSGERQR